MRKLMRQALPLLLLLLLLPAGALAAEKLTSFRVSPLDAQSIDDLRCVERWSSTGKSPWTLFIPGGWDTSALRVWFTGPETVIVNGVELRSGDVVGGLEDGKTLKVKYNGKSTFEVKVLKAGAQSTVYLSTASGSLDKIHRTKRNSETGQIVVEAADGSIETQQALTQIRCRGNSSFTKTKKKSYQFKLETKASLFGMGKAKTWVLISNFLDWSDLRNKITYDMAIYAGLQYAVESEFVNVYVCGEYRGLYLLCEKVQVNSSRVDIADLEKATEAVNEKPLSSYQHKGSFDLKGGAGKYYQIPNDPEDITGGYLFRMDYSMRYAGTPSAYISNKGKVFLVSSPKYMSGAQYNYLYSMIESVERALWSDKGVDSRTGKSLDELIDYSSFASKYVLEEFAKNRDAMFASQYFYKPADEVSTKLHAGPAWDYDGAWGGFAKDTKNLSVIKSTGFWLYGIYASSWTHRLYSHADFRSAVAQQWQETYRHAAAILLGEEKDPLGRLKSVDEYTELIRASAEMDYLRWPYKHNTGDANTGKTFDANITYLKKFISERRDWLEDQWGEAVR